MTGGGECWLLLARHASAATAAGVEDVERPLAEQGERDAAEAGRWLRSAGFTPDLVRCSAARRARTTWDLAGAQLPASPDVRYENRIYGADESQLLALVRETHVSVRTLLLIGHNPAMFRLVLNVAPEAEFSTGFPAGSVAALQLVAGSWESLGSGGGQLASFWAPADR